MRADGSCPTCGRVLPARMFGSDAAEASGAEAQTDPAKVNLRELAGEKKVPWHFKLLVFLVVVYLAWRIVQLVMWIA